MSCRSIVCARVSIKDKPRIFRHSLSVGLNARSFDGCQCDVFDLSFYERVVSEGGHLFLGEDRSCGFYVSNIGEIGSFFKLPGSNIKANAMIKIAIRHGGKFLNSYATSKLERLYVENNFNPVARMKFDERLAPEGWEKKSLHSKPDVAFFVFSPSGDCVIGGGEYFSDYDEAADFMVSVSKKLKI